MALLHRRRHNLVSTTLGSALATGATTIPLAAALQEGGSNIATLATDEYAALTIDSTAGKEVVYLTAYTSGATSGTIQRSKESTVDPGVSHPSGAKVYLVPTKFDFLGIIQETAYDPGSATDTPLTSTTLADVDATNLAVTFEGPASGKVGVYLECNAYVDSSSSRTMKWGLREGSTQIGTEADVFQNDTNEGIRKKTFVITGLTPGSIHTYKWAYLMTTGTGHMRYGSTYGQAIMRVEALPL